MDVLPDDAYAEFGANITVPSLVRAACRRELFGDLQSAAELRTLAVMKSGSQQRSGTPSVGPCAVGHTISTGVI